MAPASVLAAVVAVDLASVGVLLPLLPDLATRLELRARALGLIVGVAAAAAVVAAPRWPRLAGLVGLRVVVVSSLLATALGSALSGLAEGPGPFVLGRLLVGLSCATVGLAPAPVARHRSLLAWATVAGFVAGPLVAALAAPLGDSSPFLVVAAVALVVAVVGWVGLPDERASSRPTVASAAAPAAVAAVDRRRVTVAALLGLTATAGTATTLALVVHDRFESGPGVSGLLLAGLAFVVVTVQWTFADRRLGTGGLRGGLAVLAVGLATVGLAPAFAVAVVGVLVAGFGQGLIGLSLFALLPAPTDDGTGRARFGAAGLAAVLGPAIGARLFDVMGVAAPFLAGAVVALAGVLLVPRRPTPASAP